MSHHKKVVSHNNNKHHKGQKKKKPLSRHSSFNRYRKMKISRHTSSRLHKKPAYTSSYDHTSISLISPSVTPQACCSFSPTYSSVPTATIDASDIFHIPSVTAVASQFDPGIGQNSLTRADFPVTTTPIQMVILIVGLIGGTAFIAAAMFLVVRKRRTAFGDNKKDSSDEEDEEQRMMAYLPELALTKQTNNEYQEMYNNNEPEKENNNENKANNSSNSAAELSSAANTLVASHDSNKRELENSTSQRSSWQTFITCETARTEDMMIDSINETETRNRISIYRAKLAIPLIIHTWFPPPFI